MKKNVYVAVSTDPVPGYQEIIDYAKEMQSVADFLHCDVMDGQFVSKFTYDETLIKNINSESLIMLDVHLMTQEPLEKIQAYIDAGANFLTVHYEAFKNKKDLVETLQYIKSKGALAGISFKPGTLFKHVKPYCFDVDIILVMSVEPGASGQRFIFNTYEKIKEINKFREDNSLSFKIAVDGGVSPENSKILVDYGVDVLVSGSLVYKSSYRKKAIKDLKG